MNANELLQYLTPTAAKGTTFFLLAGPCVIEGEKMALDIAEKILSTTSELGIPYVFKGSSSQNRVDPYQHTQPRVGGKETRGCALWDGVIGRGGR